MRAICAALAGLFAFAVLAPHPPASTPGHTTTLIRKK